MPHILAQQMPQLAKMCGTRLTRDFIFCDYVSCSSNGWGVYMLEKSVYTRAMQFGML